MTFHRSVVGPPATDRPVENALPAAIADGVVRDRPLRVGVINNPRSGQNARHGLLERVRDALREHPQVPHFEEETSDGMMAAARELMARDTELIVVNGGDGTVQAVLTGLLRNPAARVPLLAVLPGGTTNSTARNVGFGTQPFAALQLLLAESARGVLAGRVERRPVIRVDTGGAPQYAMMFAAGAVYHGITFFRQRVASHGLRGQLGPALVTATFIGKVVAGGGGRLVPPLHTAMRLDGHTVAAAPYLGVLASTMDEQLMGIRPYWGTGPGPVRLTAVGYRPRRLWQAILPVLRGTPRPVLRPELGYRSVNADEVVLCFDSGFTLDGELFAVEAGEVEVTLTARQGAYFVRAHV